MWRKYTSPLQKIPRSCINEEGWCGFLYVYYDSQSSFTKFPFYALDQTKMAYDKASADYSPVSQHGGIDMAPTRNTISSRTIFFRYTCFML